MTIAALDLFRVAVPLKQKIRHASHERTDSENLIARVTLSDGTTGYGEGVPRPYVTGETVETAFATLKGVDLPWIAGEPGDIGEVVARLAAWTLPEAEADPRGMAGNAARAAAELAVVDAYGRKFGVGLDA
ncbi:MAG: dipeptide epimerase, partial [Thermoleophilia bacterium]|nr:dipeptide epimerase [Thermoleophilia bacterium]